MKKKIALTLSFLFVSYIGFSQEKNVLSADASVAFGTGFSPSIGISKNWGLGSQGKFKIGTGLRLTHFSGSNIDFITAPADLTIDDTKIDTLKMPKASVTYIAIPVHLQYSFSDKLDVGFNIDVLGATFGGKQTGKFTATNSGSFNNSSQAAKPTSANILLVGDNDRGSLNSEFYARYWVTENLGIRAGLSFQFVEYTTDNKLTFSNDRFRAKIMQPMIGISYKLR